jgi:hypothetical protein
VAIIPRPLSGGKRELVYQSCYQPGDVRRLVAQLPDDLDGRLAVLWARESTRQQGAAGNLAEQMV